MRRGGDDGDESTPELIVHRSTRTRPDINYKVTSGVREYNSTKQMMQLSRNLSRMTNQVVNNKKIKREKKKSIVGMTDMF